MSLFSCFDGEFFSFSLITLHPTQQSSRHFSLSSHGSTINNKEGTSISTATSDVDVQGQAQSTMINKHTRKRKLPKQRSARDEAWRLFIFGLMPDDHRPVCSRLVPFSFLRAAFCCVEWTRFLRISPTVRTVASLQPLFKPPRAWPAFFSFGGNPAEECENAQCYQCHQCHHDTNGGDPRTSTFSEEFWKKRGGGIWPYVWQVCLRLPLFILRVLSFGCVLFWGTVHLDL